MKLRLHIEYVYCLYSFSFPLRGKIGISGNVSERRRQIESELRYRFGDHIRVRCLAKMPILTSACAFEAAIHRALRPMQCDTLRGTNGGTEWFWAFNPVCAILLWLYLWANGSEKAPTAALFLCLVPVPLDFALYVVLLALAEYALAAGIVWALFFR